MNRSYIKDEIDHINCVIYCLEQEIKRCTDGDRNDINQLYIKHYKSMNEELQKMLDDSDFSYYLENSTKQFYVVWPRTSDLGVKTYCNREELEKYINDIFLSRGIKPSSIYFGISIEPSNLINNLHLFKDKDFFIEWSESTSSYTYGSTYVNTIRNTIENAKSNHVYPKFIIYGELLKFHIKGIIGIEKIEDI